MVAARHSIPYSPRTDDTVIQNRSNKSVTVIDSSDSLFNYRPGKTVTTEEVLTTLVAPTNTQFNNLCIITIP